ncbi:MAG: tail fiber domain-containing protein, partial [Propionibacteriaceae bacterium]
REHHARRGRAQLADAPASSSTVFGQLSASAARMVLANVNAQGQLQNALTVDPAANLVCPGNLTIGAVTAARVTATGPVQASNTASQTAQLLLQDAVSGGYGASVSHSGAAATPTLQLNLTDGTGASTPQLTLTPGQASAGSLRLSGGLTAAGPASVGGDLTLSGGAYAAGASRAVGTASVWADPNSQAATLALSSQGGSAVSTQIVSTSSYASFLQLVPGSGMTERMRFDAAGNLLFGGSLLPNSTSITLGSQSSRWNQIWATNPLNTTSDARLKREVAPTELGLDFVAALRPVSYRWKGAGPSDRRMHGFLAQDVRAAAPDDFAHVRVSEETASLQYEGLIAPLVRAVQQLTERLERGGLLGHAD